MPVERVAVIGATGEEGFGLAGRWAKAGIEVVIGSRDAGRAVDAAERMRGLVGGRVDGMQNEDAAAAASVVVVTVPFSGQAGIYRSIADGLRDDAVVIDCTVPVAASVGAKPTRTLGVWEGSAAQQAWGFIRKGTMIAAFHSLAAVALNEFDHELEGDVLVCGKKDGKETTKELVEAIPNLRYIDAGPLENARIVEPITALLIGINHRYKTDRAGIRITGLPATEEGR